VHLAGFHYKSNTKTLHETRDLFYTEVAAWQDRNHKDEIGHCSSVGV
jgi:hypothetical protein